MFWDTLKKHPAHLVAYGVLISMSIAGWTWGVDWFIEANKIIIEDTLTIKLEPLATKTDLKLSVIDIELASINEEIKFYTSKGTLNLDTDEQIRYDNLLTAKEHNEKTRNELLGLD